MPPLKLLVITGVLLSAGILAATGGLLWTLREGALEENGKRLQALTLALAEEHDRALEVLDLVRISLAQRMQGSRLGWE